jgi:predicted phosphodiesterase
MRLDELWPESGPRGVSSMIELHTGPFGLISDAHGNPFGLQAACDELRERGARTIIFLGDAVGYLPLECDVIGLLRRAQAVCVRGNHEAMLLGELPCRADEVYRLEAARARLAAEDLEFIASWPDRRLIADSRAPDRTLIAVHGSPLDPLSAYVYADSDLSFVDDIDCAALACGHTHRAFVARRGTKMIVNCGSVGLPRDVGASASSALLDLAELRCEIVRRAFDAGRLLDACNRIEPPHPDVVARLSRVDEIRGCQEIS